VVQEHDGPSAVLGIREVLALREDVGGPGLRPQGVQGRRDAAFLQVQATEMVTFYYGTSMPGAVRHRHAVLPAYKPLWHYSVKFGRG
jgi:hypothetical protein